MNTKASFVLAVIFGVIFAVCGYGIGASPTAKHALTGGTITFVTIFILARFFAPKEKRITIADNADQTKCRKCGSSKTEDCDLRDGDVTIRRTQCQSCGFVANRFLC